MKKSFYVFRHVVCFLIILFFLTACNTANYRPSDQVVSVKSYQSKKVKKAEAVKEPENVVEKYGRFTVELSLDGQSKIYGGEFVPKKELSFWSNKKHVLTINYTTKELAYYRWELSGYEPVIGYAVVTPHPDTLPKDVVRGIVTKIDRAPIWCPTPNIRQVMDYLPPGCLPYGHPLNAMGKVKFEIRWEVRGWELHRIHGTEGYAENGRFWEVQTFGCVRLQNGSINKLADLLGLEVGPEEIEVIVHR